jgi:Werner syndrome ATP-dependent helicase
VLILSTVPTDGDLHVGFDMEWPVTYSSTGNGKTALIQLCTSANKCYLFHISVMGSLPKNLKTLLCHPHVIKYGINIESDFWKLERDFDIQVRNVIHDSVKDLTPIANAKLKSTERWNLDGLTRNVLRKRLEKDGGVRCGKWDSYPLSEEQMQYAAADAYAGYLLAQHFLNK